MRPAAITGLGCGAIIAAQLLAIGLAIWLSKPASREDHAARIAAVALAAAATGPGAVAGWLVARFSRRSSPAVAAAGGLASTAFRLLPPLAALAWLSASGGALATAGGGGLLVAFYLTMLGVAVLLHILERLEAGS